MHLRFAAPVQDVAFVGIDKVGGGEIGAAIRSSAWMAATIGTPDKWPPALRSIVNLMLNSRFPMFVAWGPELTFLYNDAYVPILGTKHPLALAGRSRKIWSEIWDDVGPLAVRALEGEAIWQDDLPLTMDATAILRRRGSPSPTRRRWTTRAKSPACSAPAPKPPKRSLAVRSISEERRRLSQLFGEAPAFMALLRGPGPRLRLANDAYYQVVGHRDILGKPVRDALPEVAGQGFFKLLTKCTPAANPLSAGNFQTGCSERPTARPSRPSWILSTSPSLTIATRSSAFSPRVTMSPSSSGPRTGCALRRRRADRLFELRPTTRTVKSRRSSVGYGAVPTRGPAARRDAQGNSSR